jgi:hypothetical protein
MRDLKEVVIVVGRQDIVRRSDIPNHLVMEEENEDLW